MSSNIIDRREFKVTWFLFSIVEEMTMKKLIIWLKLIKNKELGLALIVLELLSASHQNGRVEKREITNLDDREEMKLTQLESYLSADDNQGIVDLALYL